MSEARLPADGSSWISQRMQKPPPLLVDGGLRLLVLAITSVALNEIFVNDVFHYFTQMRNIGPGSFPYRDFSWEFPPLTVLTGLLIPLGFDRYLIFALGFVGAAVIAEYVTMRVSANLVAQEHRAKFRWLWLLLFLPISTVAYFRFDWFAALFGALGLSALLRANRSRSIAAIVGGFAVKMWSVVFLVPLLARRKYLTVALSIAGCLALLGAWYLFSPSGFAAFMEYRKGSAFQIESIPGSLVMLSGAHPTFFNYGALMVTDEGWQWLQVAMPALFMVFAFAALCVAWFKQVNLVALVGALVLTLMLTSRLLSPQYLVWMAPFVGILAVYYRRVVVWFALAALLTIAELQFYGRFLEGSKLVAAVVVVRNLILVFGFIDLCRIAFQDKRFDVTSQAVEGAPK